MFKALLDSVREEIQSWWMKNSIFVVFAIVCLGFGLSGNLRESVPEKPPKIKPVAELPQQHVFIHELGGSGKSAKFDLIGMKPVMLPSPMMGVSPDPVVTGDTYVFRGRELHVRNGVPDKITLQIAGTLTKIVIIEVPEGIPVFYGKKRAPPPKKT